MKSFSTAFLILFLLSCDRNERDQGATTESLFGKWEQIEKRATLAAGWVPLGSGSFYIVKFENDGSHTTQQGNFINSYNCTGTWFTSGNALTMMSDCGRGASEEKVHYGITDQTLTWVYDFSETGRRFARSEEVRW